MANQTDHPAAVAAREAFEIAASQEPRNGLSVKLPDGIAGLSFTGNSGPTGIAQGGDMSKDTTLQK